MRSLFMGFCFLVFAVISLGIIFDADSWGLSFKTGIPYRGDEIGCASKDFSWGAGPFTFDGSNYTDIFDGGDCVDCGGGGGCEEGFLVVAYNDANDGFDEVCVICKDCTFPVDLYDDGGCDSDLPFGADYDLCLMDIDGDVFTVFIPTVQDCATLEITLEAALDPGTVATVDKACDSVVVFDTATCSYETTLDLSSCSGVIQRTANGCGEDPWVTTSVISDSGERIYSYELDPATGECGFGGDATFYGGIIGEHGAELEGDLTVSGDVASNTVTTTGLGNFGSLSTAGTIESGGNLTVTGSLIAITPGTTVQELVGVFTYNSTGVVDTTACYGGIITNDDAGAGIVRTLPDSSVGMHLWVHVTNNNQFKICVDANDNCIDYAVDVDCSGGCLASSTQGDIAYLYARIDQGWVGMIIRDTGLEGGGPATWTEVAP